MSFPPFFGRGLGREREKKTISLIFHRVQGHWDNCSVKPMCFPYLPVFSHSLATSKRTSDQRYAPTFIELKSSSVYPMKFQRHSLVDNLRSAAFLSGRHRFSFTYFVNLKFTPQSCKTRHLIR